MINVNAEDIINLIATSKKKTPVELFIKGELGEINFGNLQFFGNKEFGVVFGEYEDVMNILKLYGNKIKDKRMEIKALNSALPLADFTKYHARIEPGAFIRDMVEIGNGAIIMMGAVINIGAVIGEGTMVDMNAVVGSRAIIGKNCHIGAGAVISGVIEPPNALPVKVDDDVMVGANSVILEGIHIGKGCVIAAGAVVIEDVPEYSVVAGVPAKFIKKVDDRTKAKTQIIEGLRDLGR